MTHETFHLAQINIARMIAPLDDPRMSGFVSELPRINAIADESPGFIWRLQDDSGNATYISAFEDPLIIVNMSVWRSPEDLQAYVMHSDHAEMLRQRRKWFQRMNEIPYAMWWIPAGTTPSIEEGRERLEYLWKNGESERAFHSFKQKSG